MIYFLVIYKKIYFNYLFALGLGKLGPKLEKS